MPHTMAQLCVIFQELQLYCACISLYIMNLSHIKHGCSETYKIVWVIRKSCRCDAFMFAGLNILRIAYYQNNHTSRANFARAC